jgi:large subunit ribosomal protein L7/L12
MMWLDVVEVNMLNHEIQRRLGLNIEFGSVKDTKSAASKEVTAAVEEAKTTVDLKLVSYDEKAKIKVIKEVRAITGLGLKEAKEMVEGAPKVVKKELKPEEAEELKKKLEEVGAQIELS